jgi:hypothetical protein
MRTVRTVVLKERVRLPVIDDPPFTVPDHTRLQRRDEPPIGVLEVRQIIEGKVIARRDTHTPSLGCGLVSG